MKALWSCYSERLYQAHLPTVELDVKDVTVPIADPPISCDPPSFVETQPVVNQLKWGEAPGFCGIHAEILKAGGNAVLTSLCAVLCSAWNTGIIPTYWKWGLVIPLWKGKGDRWDCNNFARIILDQVQHHLLEHQHPEQSGFTSKSSRIDPILALQFLTESR